MAPRTLQPEDLIAHYRIVGPLGAGGMGEVYLAQDQTLERSVALKILPPELVRSEERVRRFQREAKSASSLNHPNIVTIYEIGQDEVRGHSDTATKDPSASSSVHYISMELVSGETLTTKIHHDKTDLRTLLGYLAQAAEGLAKAHAAGIVHRDLKPSNIMVSKDGFAKILDFGLAKLTEKQSADPDVTSGLTQAGDGTSAGTVVGTVAYMSPEQVRGNSVDHRSDIFSFGTILYEATTRKKPFIADSNVETMHRIIHDKPAPIEELNKEAPAELRRLIRRCLAKNPEQRLQSAKDLAIELREIVDEYESLSASGTSGSGSSALGVAPIPKRKSPAALVGRVLVLAVAVVGSILLFVRMSRHGDQAPTTPLRITTVTGRGSIRSTALSADGRYLAYSQMVSSQGAVGTGLGPGGPGSVWVRQVATGSDVQILPVQKDAPYGLRFSPDGDYLYYMSDDPDKEGYKALFAIPTLGGTPRKRGYDLDSRVSFSPDGKRVCFYRGVPQKNRDDLIILDLESGKERVLASASAPLSVGLPEWSPDGKRIAATQAQSGAFKGASVVTFRVDDGRREPVGKEAWALVNGLAWLPDGSGLVICAFDRTTLTPGQLWVLTYPEGRVHRITNDASLYANPTLSADGSTIAAVRGRREGNLWVAVPTGARNLRQITFGSGEEGGPASFDPAPDSTIVFGMLKDGSAQIWTIGTDGSGLRPVTSGPKPSFASKFRAGAGVFFNRAEDDLSIHIWRSDLDGENMRQVTSGSGEGLVDVSPDGRSILFRHVDDLDVLWSISSDGGKAVSLGASSRNSGLFSPEGSRILHALIRDINGQGVFTPQVMPAKGGEPATFPAMPSRTLNELWTPDGTSLTYLHGSNGQKNLFRVRIDGGKPEEITHFTDGRILQHRWSPDGKRLLLRRRIENADNLWVTGADGSNPTAITDFETGDIRDMKWSLDGSRAYFTYGESSQNVVLVRNFR